MNILVVSSLLPYPPTNGGLTRLYNLYYRLARHHNITWASPIWPGTEVHIPKIEQFCRRVVGLSLNDQKPFPSHGFSWLWFRLVARLNWERFFVHNYGYVKAPGVYWLPASPERISAIQQLVAEEHFDLVVCEFEGVAELVSNIHGVPKVIALHNTLSTLFQRARQTGPSKLEDRLFYWPELMKIHRYEKLHYSQFNLGITCSSQDQRILKQRCPNLPSEIISNGVDASLFKPEEYQSHNNRLMYFGHYGYPPNTDAVLYFGRQILPLIRQQIQDLHTWVVGHQPPAEFNSISGLEVTGTVPDVRPYLAQSDVVVVPLRAGSGTRLKILEAMAMGKAIVSTTLGAEGLNVTPEKDILIADNPQEFAAAVSRLLEQPELRHRIGLNARQLVEREYDWEPISAHLDEILQNVATK